MVLRHINYLYCRKDLARHILLLKYRKINPLPRPHALSTRFFGNSIDKNKDRQAIGVSRNRNKVLVKAQKYLYCSCQNACSRSCQNACSLLNCTIPLKISVSSSLLQTIYLPLTVEWQEPCCELDSFSH